MNFFKSLVQKFSGKPVDWDDLEEMLIRSDLGVPMSLRIVAALRERALARKITAQDVVEVAREEIHRVLPIQPAPDCWSERNRQDYFDGQVSLLLPAQPAFGLARRGRYLPGGCNRAARGLGRAVKG